MKTLICKIVLAVSTLALSNLAAGAQGQKAQLAACVDTGFINLASAQSKEFSSPQYSIVCQYRDVNRRKRNENFTYQAPEGFQIGSARFNVVMKTTQTSIGDLSFHGRQASMNLQCRGREKKPVVHDMVAVNIVGHLVYQPTVEDAKDIAGKCFDQILR